MNAVAEKEKAVVDHAVRRRVLFVCTGNTCRSPMAAALCRHLHKDTDADSAGISAVPLAPIAENAVKALRSRGVPSTEANDYEHHTAKRVTPELLAWADAVYALSTSHYMTLCLAFPEYAEKLYLLGEIADPYGGTEADYEEALRDIEQALNS